MGKGTDMDYVKECTLNGWLACRFITGVLLGRTLRISHVMYPGTVDVNYDVIR